MFHREKALFSLWRVVFFAVIFTAFASGNQIRCHQHAIKASSSAADAALNTLSQHAICACALAVSPAARPPALRQRGQHHAQQRNAKSQQLQRADALSQHQPAGGRRGGLFGDDEDRSKDELIGRTRGCGMRFPAFPTWRHEMATKVRRSWSSCSRRARSLRSGVPTAR